MAVETTEREPLVDAHGVHAGYGRAQVLCELDFRLAAGEVLALLGRNGMGKSTLIRCLVGHVRASRGAIRIRGRDVASLAAHARARLGLAYVPEGRAVFGNLSVRENLVVAARRPAKRQHDWTLARVLETFPPLADKLARAGAQLSGGEQQMLAIGRALMTNPDVLFLDETTEGLAPRFADVIWRLVRQLRADGMAVLIVDKNPTRVAAVADRAMILVKGRSVFDGPAAELVRRPDLVANFLGVS